MGLQPLVKKLGLGTPALFRAVGPLDGEPVIHLEFTLILPDAGAEGAAQRAEDIRRGAATAFHSGQRRQYRRSDHLDWGRALSRTRDNSGRVAPSCRRSPLYRAKSEGRDRFSICESLILS